MSTFSASDLAYLPEQTALNFLIDQNLQQSGNLLLQVLHLY